MVNMDHFNIYILNVIIYDKAAILVAVHFSMQNTELAIAWSRLCIRVGLCEHPLVMFFVYQHLYDVDHILHDIGLFCITYLHGVEHGKSATRLFQDLR